MLVKTTEGIVVRPELLRMERKEKMRERGFSLHENKCMRQLKKLQKIKRIISPGNGSNRCRTTGECLDLIGTEKCN